MLLRTSSIFFHYVLNIMNGSFWASWVLLCFSFDFKFHSKSSFIIYLALIAETNVTSSSMILTCILAVFLPYWFFFFPFSHLYWKVKGHIFSERFDSVSEVFTISTSFWEVRVVSAQRKDRTHQNEFSFGKLGYLALACTPFYSLSDDSIYISKYIL